MSSDPKYPWRIDTNDRYRELASAIFSLSTAALLLPVFFAREFLGVPEQTPLKSVFTCTAYWGWGFLSLSILSCIVFYFFSAKWARLAWEQPVGVFNMSVSENFVERALEISLWLAIIGFLSGVLLTLLFLIGYVPTPADILISASLGRYILITV